MKKMFLAAALIATTLFTSAQLGNVLKHAKDKATSTANNKANSSVDNTVDKTVNGTDTNDPNSTNNTNTNTNQNTPANNTTQNNTNNNNADTTGKETAANTAPASIKAYSKYDFVPGEKVIAFEDFSTGNIGDFPGGWNTNAAAEIVTIEGKEGRWLWLTKPGMFLPELAQPLP